MREEIFTAPWIAAWHERLVASESFRALATGWDTTLVVAAGDRAAFLALTAGGCREARVATSRDRAAARFVLAADPNVWEELLGGRLDPAAAVMSGQLRIERGGLMALLPFVPAARQLLAEAASAASGLTRGESGA